MATRSDTVGSRPGKQESAVLGRSAATGRFVMTPASKRGSITVNEAQAAAKSVTSGKKR